MNGKQSPKPEARIKEIRRQTLRKFTSEEKIRIVLEGLKGEASIAKLQ
jgi:transposase